MNRKYELTQETITLGNHILHRIRARRSFGDVKSGDLGGFIESENNLSAEGNCWIGDDAKVYENASVSDGALVSGDTWVCGESQIYGHARICGGVQIYGHARVYENAQISGNIILCDWCRVRGNAILSINFIFESIIIINLTSGVWIRAICENNECYLISTTLQMIPV